ncbi:hypothetical protein DH2020_009649 [Rehmannia glutinosa]|uniref:F-box domain-containing protein n=1 Tax=Rehmannia glutinosa TaxID=99300 RepID=A0ABR0X977_REHGL
MEKQGLNQRKLLMCNEEKQTIERDDDGFNFNSMDRISQLPESVLHHILSFLSQKEATQTCLLAKSWRHVSSTRPNIEFLEENWFKGNKVAFLSVLDKTLQRYHDQMLRIQEFRVKISKLDSESISLLEKWIPIIMVNMGVKTFNLDLFSNTWELFDLPSVVFKVESLQKLDLLGCKLNIQNPLNKVQFKHLQTLHLTQVYIDDETFHKIISSCPLIEVVSLYACEGLRTIKMNKGHNLKKFDFSDVTWDTRDTRLDDDCSIEIDVQTIETIKISGDNHWYHQHNYLPHLKSLNLIDVRLASWPFDIFSLDRRNCSGLTELQLSNHSIKHLTIEGLDRPGNKASIDAPNIVKFEYVGNIPPSFAFATTFSEWKSDITLDVNAYFDDDDHDLLSQFLKLNDLLKEVSRSEISLTLVQHRHRNRHIAYFCGGLCKPVVVEHLSLRGFHASSCFPDFLNCLFRICRPRYIDMFLHANPLDDWERQDMEITEFFCKNLLIRERERTHYFWQRALEEVSLESFDDKGQEWHHVVREGTSLFEIAAAFPIQPTKYNRFRSEQLIRIRLKWREIKNMSRLAPNI